LATPDRSGVDTKKLIYEMNMEILRAFCALITKKKGQNHETKIKT